MDHEILTRQLIAVHRENAATLPWDIMTYCEVIGLFISEYKKHIGRDHPNFTKRSLLVIMERLPAIYDEQFDDWIDLDTDDYRAMIPKYFQTSFPHCDYSMHHFVSGNIRLMRWFETRY